MLKELSAQIIRGIGNMESLAILGLSLLCIVGAQRTYDGSNGSQQVLIRGQNEGSYQVPGVAGTFQNTPGGSHSYTDEQGNTYVHKNNGAGESATQHDRDPTVRAYRGTRSDVVSRPNRDVATNKPDFRDGSAHKERECFDLEKPGTQAIGRSEQITEDGKRIKTSEYYVEIERVCFDFYYAEKNEYINSR
ncbi:uncharacterized protein LOC135426714 isoform X2 [Drosophila montana]|uniref:uncharacterized protein LOC135426714 isoform X2 n=1 Tax=Drosophila montana TaxID=40370 RepID=UPI00313AA46C